MQELARYWATEYDWRKVEARLNALPQFITEIDGVDIHFIHVRSKHEDALPLIVSHGWPGSVIEQLKIIEPLTNPTAHGGKASDAFHVVIPNMPGYGFSGKPTTTGWDPVRIARAWIALMKRLGYKRFVAQGGDWGGVVVDMMAVEGAPELIGIHTNMPGAVPADVWKAVAAGGPVPSDLSDEERQRFEKMKGWFAKEVAYALQMGLRPQTLYGIADSPVGLAAWMIDHDLLSYQAISRLFVDGTPYGAMTRDDVLDNITLSWLTTTGISAGRLYWENKLPFFESEGRLHPGRRERVSRRDRCGAAELGRTGVSQAHPLQPARSGWALRRLGAAEVPGGRAAHRAQVVAVADPSRRDGAPRQSSTERMPMNPLTEALPQSTVVPIDDEPAPRLIVEPPLPGPLAQGVAFIPYRVENLRILPVGGAAATRRVPAGRPSAHHGR